MAARSAARQQPEAHFADQRSITTSSWLLLALSGFAFAVYLWGVRQELPFTPSVDEPLFTLPAMQMIASGDLSPHWFGHPASTLIYPLALLGHIWNVLAYGGPLFQPDPHFMTTFAAHASDFYLIGRLINIGYAVASVPLIFLIGRRAFDPQVGLIGAWPTLLSPLLVEHARMVRSDSAALFFALLALCLILRCYDQPTRRNCALAGAAIGLALASRYFMAALVPVLLLAILLRTWPQRPWYWPSLLTAMGAGLLAVGAVFVMVTPFFVLEWRTALSNLLTEARASHLGADGFTPLGNIWWYLSVALPASTSLPQTLLAGLGMGLALRQRNPQQLLLVTFVLIFLAGLSISPLHWQRWIIQLVPVLALFSAAALLVLVGRGATWLQARLARPRFQWLPGPHAWLILALAALTIGPFVQVVLLDLRHATPSTRVLAREWIVRNLPAGSRIAQEWYAAPLSPADMRGYARDRVSESQTTPNFQLFERASLATDRTLDDYSRAGYDYLVVSSWRFNRYFAAAQRYPAEVAFYRRLFAEGRLVQEFRPSLTRDGPLIRIYALAGP